MPVVQDRNIVGGGGSYIPVLVTFLVGLLIILIAVLIIVHSMMHLF